MSSFGCRVDLFEGKVELVFLTSLAQLHRKDTETSVSTFPGRCAPHDPPIPSSPTSIPQFLMAITYSSAPSVTDGSWRAEESTPAMTPHINGSRKDSRDVLGGINVGWELHQFP